MSSNDTIARLDKLAESFKAQSAAKKAEGEKLFEDAAKPGVTAEDSATLYQEARRCYAIAGAFLDATNEVMDESIDLLKTDIKEAKSDRN